MISSSCVSINGMAQSGSARKRNDNTNTSDLKNLDYNQILRDTIEEMEENVKNGTIPKPVIPNGAKAYTDEEWDKLIDKIDESIDLAKEAVREETKEKEEEEKEKEIYGKAD